MTKGGRPLAPSTASRYHKCRCDDCRAWMAEQSRVESARAKAKRAAGTMPKQRRKMATRECAMCGTAFACRAVSSTRTCSLTCTGKLISETNLGMPGHGLSRRERARRKAARAEAGVEGARVLVVGPCPVCGTAIAGVAQTCSTRCKRALTGRAGSNWIGKARRVRLYERDDYVCQICHEPTDPGANHLSNWYPSLDHIVPRSKGGTHEDANLRTAHRYCNAILGDGTYYTEDDLKAPGSE